MTLLTRKRAASILRGHKRTAAAVQGIVLCAEGILWLLPLWLPGSAALNTVLVLVLDLLLVSPLKAGRAFFFETLTADSEAARLSLLWRYYRHGYGRTVGWRVLLWGCRAVGWSLFLIPALVLFVYSGRLVSGVPTYTDTLLSLTLFGLGLLLAVTALAAVEVILLRLVAVPYLLSHTGGLRGAVALSRRLMQGRIGTMTLVYLDYAGWMLACVAVLPWFYASSLFHTARVAAIHAFLRQIPAQNTRDVLQRRKKYGKIGG